MAGKTLPGIGEDESGEHEGADLSDSGLREGDKPASARPTDRMPLSLPTATLHGQPNQTLVDDDKVAEGLKKLRSLDEPLGSLATTTPTMKEGMPVVGATPPLMTPAVAAAELLRSRGTAHGHAITPGVVQAMLPVTVDDRMKGTLLGHSLHLPDLPAPSEENRPAEVHSVSSVVITDLAHAQQVPPAGSLRRSEMHGGFSHGDAPFFENDPAATDVYPFEKPARSNFMFRGVVFFAAVAVVGVAAFAWFNARKSGDETEARAPAPAVEGTVTPPAAGEIAPAANPAATPAPAGMAGAAPAAAPPAAAAPAPTPPAAAPADEAPAESPTAKLKRELAAAEAAKAPRATNRPTPTRTSRRSDKPSVAPTPTPVTKPAPPPGKHGKVTEDPDGTLPLSD